VLEDFSTGGDPERLRARLTAGTLEQNSQGHWYVNASSDLDLGRLSSSAGTVRIPMASSLYPSNYTTLTIYSGTIALGSARLEL